MKPPLFPLCVCLLIGSLGCQAPEVCAPPELVFHLEEGLKKSWLGEAEIDTFFHSREVESFQPIRGRAPSGWETYHWVLLNPSGDTMRQWFSEQWLDSTIAVPFGQQQFWTLELHATYTCGNQEMVEVKTSERVRISHDRPSLLLRNQYDGYLLSRREESITLTIETQSPPNITSGWHIQGIPLDCEFGTSRVEIGHRALIINAGEYGSGNCRSIQGIGVLAENEIDFRLEYSYHPEGSNERIYETFVGTRKWR